MYRISMWDSPGTFTNSPDLPSGMGNLMACSANPLYYSKKILGNGADLMAQGFLEQELLQILAVVETNTEQSQET